MSGKTIQVMTSNTADRKMEVFYKENKGFRNVLASFLSDKCRKKYGNVFVCTVCCTMFRLQTSLQDHIRGAHLNIRKCGHCHKNGKEFVFVTRGNFVSHVKQFHKGMDQSVKSHIVIPRPEAKKVYAIDQTATLKAYSKNFLEKALRLYCANEGIELIGLSSQDNCDRPDAPCASTSRTVLPQSIEHLSDDLRNEAFNKALPIRVRKSCDRAPETQINVLDTENDAIQDQEISTSLDVPLFEDSQNAIEDSTLTFATDALLTLGDTCRPTYNFFFDPILPIEDIVNQLKIWKPLFDNRRNSKSLEWKKACLFLYRNSNVEGNIRIISNRGDENESIHGFIYSLWMKPETVESTTSGCTFNVADLNVGCINLMKQLMYGVVDETGFVEDSYKMCQIIEAIDDQSKFAAYLISCLKKTITVPIIQHWLAEKDFLQRPAPQQLVLWFVLRNQSYCFDPNGPLLRIIPFEMIEKCRPQNLHHINSRILCDESEWSAVTVDHCQLLEFLFKWTCKQLALPRVIPTVLQQSVAPLKDLIHPTVFSFHNLPLDNEAIAKHKRASFYYFKLFCTCFETENFTKTYAGNSHTYEIRPINNFNCQAKGLQNFFMEQLFSKEFANTIIMFDPSWYINSSFLKLLCPSLLSMITKSDTQSNQHSTETVQLPASLDNPIFQQFLQCCHNPMLSPSDPSEIKPLLYLAIMFKVDSLCSHLYNSMKNRKTMWTPATAIMVLHNAGRMNMNDVVNECGDFVKRHLEKLQKLEAFYTVTDIKIMLMLLSGPRPPIQEEKLISSVYKWCIVQSLMNSSMDLETLKLQVKPLLNFTALTQEARIKMQEETKFLSIREYDKLCVTHTKSLLHNNDL